MVKERSIIFTIKFVFSFKQTTATGSYFSKFFSNNFLPLMKFHIVQNRGHKIVERRSNLIHPHCRHHTKLEQTLCIVLVDNSNAGHHAGAVGHRQSLAHMYRHRFQPTFLHHLGGSTPYAVIVHLPLSDEAKGDVRQLHQVATRTYTPMFGDKGIDAAVDKLQK